MEDIGIPDSISIYAVRYCIEKALRRGRNATKCFTRNSSGFGVAFELRIALALLYAVGITSSILSLAVLLHALIIRCQDDKHRYWSGIWTWIALGAVLFGSVTVTVVIYAVHMALAENLPRSILSVEIGEKFRSYMVGMRLLSAALVLMRSEKMRNSWSLNRGYWIAPPTLSCYSRVEVCSDTPFLIVICAEEEVLRI
ncbi:uncharacterized protein EI97DRAFT_501743 [Westerdykella ornata]|uniref:Uncharacterized protein n=1 Tax=Westerdykella ornata TaxID=318751 RepID=A0A6A6JM72_WESOR|nr:uncharacterized protein EI97DRAFT_501743 [Westerdykella ornata]KAF2276019.1 hypothetical protein EI97DRAFT_501743 [Westerdykella ornata]